MEAREAYEGLLAWYDETTSEDTQHAPPISAQVSAGREMLTTRGGRIEG